MAGPGFLFLEKIGANSATGVGKETTFGTPVVPDSFLPFQDNTMDVDPGLFSPAVMTGTRDLQVYALYGQEKDAGAIGAPLFPTNGVELLVYAIGSDVVTGGSPGPYTHTILQTNTLPSVTVEKNLGNFQ